jgi:uncharacterized integral membrane protein/hemerythrin superfamily protein
MLFVYLLVAILGVGAALFTLQNHDMVAVNFLQWRTVELPVSLVILLSAFVGILIASISAFAQQIQLERRIRKLQRRLAELAPSATSPPYMVSPVGRPRFLRSAAPPPIPIRGGYSLNAIEFLKQEHEKAKAAFDKVLQASPQQRGRLWQELAPELKLHEEIEDACLYEPLSRDKALSDHELAGWRKRHQEEVQRVGNLLEAIRGLRPDEPAWMDKVKEVHTSLELHIQEEEGTIFPRISKACDENRLERAGAQMADMKSKHMGRVA